MLAEMRALGQGILIADQLPTAIAPQAVKQTNVKVLMRVTAKDDREEIGNTMDLNEEQLHQVVNFKTGHAYLYHEGEDHVRMIRMANFKGEHKVEEPPSDEELHSIMSYYEDNHRELYLPYEECSSCCRRCNRRVRNQAESYISSVYEEPFRAIWKQTDASQIKKLQKTIGICDLILGGTKSEMIRIQKRYNSVGDSFSACCYVHLLNMAKEQMADCKKNFGRCTCDKTKHVEYLEKYRHLYVDDHKGE